MATDNKSRPRFWTLNRALIALAAAGVFVCAAVAFWQLSPRRVRFYSDADTIRQPIASTAPRDVLWQPPVALPEIINLPGNVYEPRVAWDGLTLYFVRGKAGGTADIYVCTRTPTGWTEPAPLEGVNSDADDLGPAPTADGQSLYFYSDRAGGQGGYDLWVAHRGAGTESWQPPINLGPAVNSEFNDYGPAPTADAKTLYFASNRPLPDDARKADPNAWPATVREDLFHRTYDLYVTTMTDAGPARAAPLMVLNTAANEGAPCVSPFDDFLYFASDRAGGLGGFDIYRSRRLRGQQLPAQGLREPVNSPANELDPGLTMGGYRLFFSSDRPAQRANPDKPNDYQVYVSSSREVFLDAESLQRPPFDWAALMAFLPNLLWLLLALLLLLAMFYLWRASKDKRLSLLARCLLVSLLLHSLLMMLLAVWNVSAGVAQMIRSGGGGEIRVALGPAGGGGDDISVQIRGGFTDIAAPAAAPSPMTRAEPAPTVDAAAALASLSAPAAPLETPQQPAVTLTAAEAPAPAAAQPPDAAPAAPRPAPASDALHVSLPADAAAMADAEAAGLTYGAPVPRLPVQRPDGLIPTSQPAAELADLGVRPSDRPTDAALVGQSLAGGVEATLRDAPPTQPQNVVEIAVNPVASDSASAGLDLATPRESGRQAASAEPSEPGLAAAPGFFDSPRAAAASAASGGAEPIAPTEVVLAPSGRTAQAIDDAPFASGAAGSSSAASMNDVSDARPDMTAPAMSGGVRVAGLPATDALNPALPAETGAIGSVSRAVSEPGQPTLSTVVLAGGGLARAAVSTGLGNGGGDDATPVDVRLTPIGTDSHNGSNGHAGTGDGNGLPGSESLVETSGGAGVADAMPGIGAPTGVSGGSGSGGTGRALGAPGGTGGGDLALPMLESGAGDRRGTGSGSGGGNGPGGARDGSGDGPFGGPGAGLPGGTGTAGGSRPDITRMPGLGGNGSGGGGGSGTGRGTGPGLANLSPGNGGAADGTGTVPGGSSLVGDGLALTADVRPIDVRAPIGGVSPSSAADLTRDRTNPDRLGLRLPAETAPPDNSYAQRSPEQRQAILPRMGGDERTEQAVAAALAWLARHQSPDGRWAASDFDAACNACEGRPTEHADIDVASTGLALLCFLGANHTHTYDGPYRDNVRRGVEWLKRVQQADGDLRQGYVVTPDGEVEPRSETMYSHGIASIALSEAFGMTGDPSLLDPVRRAAAFIVAARNQRQGGWRYDPGQAGDTSVLGWQVMALKSAEMAGLDLPHAGFEAVRNWIDLAAAPGNPGLYCYRPRQRPTESMTAEGMFVQQLMGVSKADPRMRESALFVTTRLPDWSEANTYFWYYATLALFQHQGEAWERWNAALKPVLLDNQRKGGPPDGSWDPAGEWTDIGGRVYQTALCTLMLEVYYRYLPLYSTQPPGDDTVGAIRGRVTDAETGQPVAHATIRLTLPSRAPIVVTSSAEGRYSLRAPELPEFFALSASAEGYVPETANVPLARLIGQTLTQNFPLRKMSGNVIAIEADPEVHHLGNNAFEGSINSQFQRTAEGLRYAAQFELTDAQVPPAVSRAALWMMNKGVQCPHEIYINGQHVGGTSRSPDDGSFGEDQIEFGAGLLKSGMNTIEIQDVSCTGDLDDFEFVNLQIRLSR